MSKPTCSTEDCKEKKWARDWCRRCYDVERRAGNPLIISRAPRGGSVEQRFLFYVDKTSSPTGCWLWTAGMQGPYGRFAVKGRNFLVHRWAWENWKSSIPEGLTVDHLCFTTTCVNVDHMEVVTRRSPAAMARRALTHCPRNHPYDEANTLVLKSGSRACRKCHGDKTRERRKHGHQGNTSGRVGAGDAH